MCYRWTLVAMEGTFFEESNSGRDYSGILWIMGRFDRGWPERRIFGKLRSMTSTSTRRKVSWDRHLACWVGVGTQGPLSP
jgi:deoxyribodipyrimidine photo-lyase